MKNIKVAVLNYDGTFNNVSSWKRALILIEKGKAEVVEYSDHCIQTINKVIQIPKMIRLLKMVFKIFKQYIRFSKKSLVVRDGGKCCYCGKELNNDKDHLSKMTVDHVVPKSLGGKSSWTNCVSACVECNTKKKNLTLHEAGMTLLTKPYTPTVALFQRMKVKKYLNEFDCLKDYVK